MDTKKKEWESTVKLYVQWRTAAGCEIFTVRPWLVNDR